MDTMEKENSLLKGARCPKCGGAMYVTRRSPHPVIIQGEKQVMTCHSCGAQASRNIDEDGTEIGFGAA
jgi:transcription elongation factor Elf1